MDRCDPFGFPKPQEKSSHDQDPCRRGDSIARPQRIRARAVDNYRRPCRDGACNRRANADAPSSSSPPSSSPSHAPHGARGRPGSGGSAISRTAAQRLRLEVKQNIQLSGQRLSGELFSSRLRSDLILRDATLPMWPVGTGGAWRRSRRSRVSFSAAPACAS